MVSVIRIVHAGSLLIIPKNLPKYIHTDANKFACRWLIYYFAPVMDLSDFKRIPVWAYVFGDGIIFFKIQRKCTLSLVGRLRRKISRIQIPADLFLMSDFLLMSIMRIIVRYSLLLRENV